MSPVYFGAAFFFAPILILGWHEWRHGPFPTESERLAQIIAEGIAKSLAKPAPDEKAQR